MPDIVPPVPSSPTPGSSPLIERIHPDTCVIEIKPAFGAQLHVVLHSNSGMPETAQDSVAAVTVYGDGRIEYHTAADDEPAPCLLADTSEEAWTAPEGAHQEVGGAATSAEPVDGPAALIGDGQQVPLPWTELMDGEDLHDFLGELAEAAQGFFRPLTDDAETLRDVKAVCGTWRNIAEAQYAHNTTPGPNAEGSEQ